jgi:dehydrogenase/reductase SDR family member 12
VDARSLLDDALEITVVGSFSRLGFAIRRRLHGWTAPAPGSLDGRTVLVTGPTSGLGRAMVDGLAGLGARVVLVGRSRERLAAVRDELVDHHGSDRFPIVVADMARAASVQAAVEQVLATEARLDVLVDNAGAIHAQRTVTEDGIEATLATMVANPFVLVSGLLPLLRRDGGGRVIAVTSGGMYTQGLDLDDLQYEVGSYDGVRAYARAKRAQVALVREWSRRIGGRPTPSVRFDAMHPGWADTPGLAESLPGFHRLMGPLLRTAVEGADTAIWLATGADADTLASRDHGRAGTSGGRLYLDRRARPFDRLPGTRLDLAARRRLWDLVVGLSGSPDPAPEPRP